jgi:hypothetical protein
MFLEAVEAEKTSYTFSDYQRWCVEFAKLHGTRQARDLTRLDAQKFKQHLLTATWVRNKQPPQPYKPKTINHAIISLRRAFNWAIDNEILPEGRNPFARLKLLSCQGRKRVALEGEALRHGQEVETTGHSPRFYTTRREPGVYPTTQEMYVAAPALADDKARTGFEEAWEVSGRRLA